MAGTKTETKIKDSMIGTKRTEKIKKTEKRKPMAGTKRKNSTKIGTKNSTKTNTITTNAGDNFNSIIRGKKK